MDGPGRGGAPLPWDMEEPPANMFKEEVLTLLVMVMAKNIMIQLYVCCSCHRFPIVGIKLLVPSQVRVVTVPHTGVVKACHKCRGTGGMSCRDCSGKVSNNIIIIIVIITFIISITMLGLLRQGNHRHSVERSPSARTNVNFGAIYIIIFVLKIPYLGTDDATKMDEFSEKFQRKCDC